MRKLIVGMFLASFLTSPPLAFGGGSGPDCPARDDTYQVVLPVTQSGQPDVQIGKFDRQAIKPGAFYFHGQTGTTGPGDVPMGTQYLTLCRRRAGGQAGGRFVKLTSATAKTSPNQPSFFHDNNSLIGGLIGILIAAFFGLRFRPWTQSHRHP